MQIELEEVIVGKVKVVCKGIQACEKLCPGNRKTQEMRNLHEIHANPLFYCFYDLMSGEKCFVIGRLETAFKTS